MTKVIVLFVGKSGSGKSTAANILSTKYAFVERAFATPLKNFALLVGFT